ncbi:MAG: branched-chain amino acid ABC transporter permease [Acidimicrobiia bacterium]
MTLFLQLTIDGWVAGSLYLLMALGLVLMFGALRVPNVALGQGYAVGAMVTYVVLGWGVPYPGAVLGAAVVGALIGIVTELVFRRIPHESELHGMIAAFAIFFALEAGGFILWGPDPRAINWRIPGTIHLGDLILTYHRLALALTALALIVALFVTLQKTAFGRDVRAVAQNRDAATVLGVDVKKVALVVFALAGALTGLAGALSGTQDAITPAMALFPTLKAFVIIVVGGMTLRGAVVAAYVLALSEVYAAGYVSSGYKDAVAFILLAAILVIRPQGIMGIRSHV